MIYGVMTKEKPYIVQDYSAAGTKCYKYSEYQVLSLLVVSLASRHSAYKVGYIQAQQKISRRLEAKGPLVDSNKRVPGTVDVPLLPLDWRIE
jgi:hypothetical protein